jgi:hypothetical protein
MTEKINQTSKDLKREIRCYSQPSLCLHEIFQIRDSIQLNGYSTLNDAMYAMSGIQLLAQGGYIRICKDSSIKSIPPFPGGECSMSSAHSNDNDQHGTVRAYA